jgi:hypothetical protein
VVTTLDAGKFLRVSDDGEWAAQEAVIGGASGKLANDYYMNMATTSKKIALYEAKNTSDDIFIKFDGGDVSWYRAVCNEGTEVLEGIYWIDKEHTSLTVDETEWPVTVYTYDEEILMSNAVVDGVPKMILGNGNGNMSNPDYGKFFIEKTSEMVKVYLLNSSGDEVGIDIGDQYLDLKGLRKPTDIDFTDAGFTVTMDGGGSMSYTYTKEAGNITAITDQVGHVTNVSFTITATASTEVE